MTEGICEYAESRSVASSLQSVIDVVTEGICEYAESRSVASSLQSVMTWSQRVFVSMLRVGQ